MKLTVEPDEVEAAVLAYVQSKFGEGAAVEVVRFTRAQGTGKVYAEVHVEPQPLFDVTATKEDE